LHSEDFLNFHTALIVLLIAVVCHHYTVKTLFWQATQVNIGATEVKSYQTE